MKRKVLFLSVLVLAVLLCFSLVSCGGVNNPLEVGTPTNIRYDGATISWDAVENADSYVVRINDGSEYSVTVPSYPFTNSSAAQFNVTIKAVSNTFGIQSAEAVKTFSPIDPVSNFTVLDGNFVWDPAVISGGTVEYILRVDGKELPPIAFTEYPVENLGEGRHQVQVRPSVSGNDSYYAVWSETKTVTVLGTVLADRITYKDGVIKWNSVQSATGYELSINGEIVETGYTSTSFQYDAQSSSFDVEIKALGNGSTVFDGKKSEAKSFIYLETVSNITVEDGVVCWDAVEGADGYQIKINGTVQQGVITDNRYDKVATGMSVDLQLLPVCNGETAYFSEWSAVNSIFILGRPVLKWNSDYALDGEANSNVYWDGVSNADGYTVRVTLPDGTQQIENFSSTQRAFQEAYLQVGEYKVEVKANAPANGNGTYDSLYSNPIIVRRLGAPAPASKNYIVSNVSDISAGFTVSFQGVNGATGYCLYRDGVEVQRGTSNQFVVNNFVDSSVTVEQTFNFKVQSLGSVKDNKGTIYATLPSLSSESMSFKITVLATPQDPTISGFNYSFGSINGSNGYSVNIGSTSKTFTSGETSFDLRNAITTAGNFYVSVCAKGNGSDVLPSNYSSPILVNRLSAPTNIRIDTSDASEGVMSYNPVANATGYYAVFDNNGEAVPVETISNMNQYVTEQGTTVYLVSEANYFNNDNTVYYMESVPSTTANFIKLSAPTFGDVAFTNTQLIWKAPANMNTAIYTPTYEIYNASGVKYNGEKNGLSMNLSYLEGGAEYTFYIKAIGNGTDYINSEKSTPVTIYKLATPEVTRQDGKYVWSSVVDATSYVVYVDGKLMQTYPHEPGKTYEYTPSFDKLKTYTVEVYAIGDGGYTTIDAEPYVIEQSTKQLSTPDFTFRYSEESYSNTGMIVVNITDEPAYATGYSYTVGGATYVSAETEYSYLPSSVGTFKIGVYALGGSFDEEGVYYLDSQTQGNNSSYQITLLATPNKSSIEISEDGKVTWTTISGAVRYKVTIVADGEVVFDDLVKTSSCVLNNYKNYSQVVVTVQAIGNGTTIINSTPVEKEWIL